MGPNLLMQEFLLAFYCQDFWEEKKKSYCNRNAAACKIRTGDEQVLGLLQGKTHKKNWIVENGPHLLSALSKAENLEDPAFCESIVLLPMSFCRPGALRVNGTK